MLLCAGGLGLDRVSENLAIKPGLTPMAFRVWFVESEAVHSQEELWKAKSSESPLNRSFH